MAISDYNGYPQVEVLGDGFVRLDGHLADDLSVVNAARVSFAVRHGEIKESDPGLLGYLMANHHGTPFEHNLMRFHVKAPIAVYREWHRHRIGVSINEQSARYSELPGSFYVPKMEDVRAQVGKPGHYRYEQAPKEVAENFVRTLDLHCQQSYAFYQAALRQGVAKEQARFFLPNVIYSEMYWSCNARSLMAFLSLRNHPTAQWEIRQYAQALEELWATIMPITYDAFVTNGRQAP